MPKLFEITGEWSSLEWFNTGGTRAKKYLQSSVDGKYYYFKRSQYKDPVGDKPGKDFKYEFWSEIIAFELGTLLGFNVLRYDIATDGAIMGCISESMINSEKEELIEGVKFLQGYSRKYDPALREHQTWYTFQFIESALKSAKIRWEVLNQLVEIVVFDALIGNGDRHQENWAIISKPILISNPHSKKGKDGSVKFAEYDRAVQKSIKNILSQFKKTGKKPPKEFYVNENIFAPIYDSGSSLGRELTEKDVERYCLSDKALEKYIGKGNSEIHWKDKKVNHFELIDHLLDSRYKKQLREIWKRVNRKWDENAIGAIIANVDSLVPEQYKGYKIPDQRKELIFKILTHRKRTLEVLFNERIR